MESSFATLRTLLLEEPSEELWKRLVQFVEDSHNEEELPLLLEYAQTHMDGWDDLLRLSEGLKWESPWWPLVRSLNVGEHFHESDLYDMMLQSPEKTSQLTALTMSWVDPKTSDLLQLFQDPDAFSLTYVDFEGNSFKDSDAERLLQMPALYTLKELRLGWNNIKRSGLKALANNNVFQNLTILRFENNDIVNDDIIELVDSPLLEKLELLRLYNNDVNDTGAIALVRSAACRNLKSLDFSNNHLTDASAMEIAKSPHLAQLEELNIDDNSSITEKGWREIVHSTTLKETRITGDFNKVTGDLRKVLDNQERFTSV